MEAHGVIWIVTVTTWAFLLFNSVRLHLVSKYHLVFAFIFTSIALEASMPWIASIVGVGTQLYAGIYMVTATLNLGLAAAVLLSIYATLEGLSLRRDWHLIVAPGLLIGLTLSDGQDIWTFERLVNVASLVMTYLGIAAILRSRRCKDVELGWNLKMVLLAVTVPYVFQSVVFTVYKIGLPLSYEAFTLWLHGTSLAAWIILAVGMMEYSPPTLVAADGSESGESNGESGREQTVGHLSETRDQLC